MRLFTTPAILALLAAKVYSASRAPKKVAARQDGVIDTFTLTGNFTHGPPYPSYTLNIVEDAQNVTLISESFDTLSTYTCLRIGK